MQLSEQDIMNAICLHMAERKGIRPEQVEVELMWDESLGFSAEVTAEGRSQYLIEANMLEAIERYLYTVQGIRVFRSQIRLQVDQEMTAHIEIA
ncbi:YxcD family protein [Gorillibacterium sp. sgz5001074]|uniref:YxcD family protein n=1 Tax=Gorillibacterium sp. sgz5001074 TaxID=3446695 RepID=UPI003F677358